MGGIFITYRREDSAGCAGRLHDRLSERFGRDTVFIGVDTLEPRHDFPTAIAETIDRCDVLIAMIGRRWLEARDDQERRRIEQDDDFNRIEIAAALERGISIVPVLVDGAEMPRPDDLPQSIDALARRHAVALNPAGFNDDTDRLIETLIRSGSLPETDPAAECTGGRGALPLRWVAAGALGIVALAVVVIIVSTAATLAAAVEEQPAQTASPFLTPEFGTEQDPDTGLAAGLTAAPQGALQVCPPDLLIAFLMHDLEPSASLTLRWLQGEEVLVSEAVAVDRNRTVSLRTVSHPAPGRYSFEARADRGTIVDNWEVDVRCDE